MTAPVGDDLGRAVDRVRQAYLPVAEERVSRLSAFADRLARGEDATVDQGAAADLAHQLSGSLGVFIPGASSVAADLEAVLRHPGPPAVDEVRSHVLALSAMLRSLAAGGTA